MVIKCTQNCGITAKILPLSYSEKKLALNEVADAGLYFNTNSFLLVCGPPKQGKRSDGNLTPAIVFY